MSHSDTLINQQDAGQRLLTRPAYQQTMPPLEKIVHIHTDQNSAVLHTLFEHIRDGLALINHHGLVLAVNAALSDLLGMPVAHITNRSWQHICQPDEQSQPGFPGLWVLNTLHTGQSANQRESFASPDGTMRMLDIRTVPVMEQATPDEDMHRVHTVIVHVVDVTRQYTLEALHRERAIMAATSALIGIMAHEINTPLQSLMCMLDLLEHSDDHDQEHDALVHSARCEVRRIRDVLRRAHNQYISPTDAHDTH